MRPLYPQIVLFALLSTSATAQSTPFAQLPPEAQSSIAGALDRTRSGTRWKQKAELIPSDGQQYSLFGISVAVSGDTVVVGAPGYADNQGNATPGYAYVFVKPTNGWSNMLQVAELSASDGGDHPGYNFGWSVAIANNTIFVGAPNLQLGNVPNEVYVYSKPSAGWQNMTENAILTAGFPSARSFGTSLATTPSAETLVVGAVYNEFNNTPMGAAYVFVEPKGGWKTTSTPAAQLALSNKAQNDRFGGSVAIDGDAIVVGADGKPELTEYGAAYVFVKPKTGWKNMTQTANLTAAQPIYEGFLGQSVTILGNTIAAGSPFGTKSKPAGGVYLFQEPAGGWKTMTESAILTNNANIFDLLGWSVALTANFLVAGAPQATVGQNQNEGAAYVFQKPAAGWKSTSKVSARLAATYGEQNDAFGVSVSTADDTIFCGAPDSYNYSDVGLAYVFQLR